MRGVLAVSAPAGAQVIVNGVPVGQGEWRTDTLPAGMYTVVAALPRRTGCPSTRDSARVALGGTGSETVNLEPRGCGTLALDVTTRGATYEVTSHRDDVRRTGELPLSRPIVLPAGSYRLTVEAPWCAPYSSEVRIVANRAAARERLRLICERR